jgi:hypothetical protein
MKHILIFAFLLSASAFSQTKLQSTPQSKWSDLEKDKKYKTDREIVLEKDDFKLVLPAKANIQMVEAMSLPMIKVELLKFDISAYCNDSENVSDIKLIDIRQPSGLIVTVGADLSEDCIMEVFIETKDVYSNSIFK